MTVDACDSMTTTMLAQRREFATAFEQICQLPDPLFRELAVQRTSAIVEELRQLATGEIVFTNTDAWRVAYEKLLNDLNFSTYQSVAWVRTSSYWRDAAGRGSIRLNYDLLDRGLRIERILILPDTLWETTATPAASIRTWIEEQHYRGIALSLIRESDLNRESDLICDFGIYGERATGEQLLDEEARTISFQLKFAPPAVHAATQRWERLRVFSRPCQELIDL